MRSEGEKIWMERCFQLKETIRKCVILSHMRTNIKFSPLTLVFTYTTKSMNSFSWPTKRVKYSTHLGLWEICWQIKTRLAVKWGSSWALSMICCRMCAGLVSPPNFCSIHWLCCHFLLIRLMMLEMSSSLLIFHSNLLSQFIYLIDLTQIRLTQYSFYFILELTTTTAAMMMNESLSLSLSSSLFF